MSVSLIKEFLIFGDYDDDDRDHDKLDSIISGSHNIIKIIDDTNNNKKDRKSVV